MTRVWQVLKFEFIKTVFRRSFILALILTPLIPLVGMYVFSVMEGRNTQAVEPVAQLLAPPVEVKPEGFIDNSGLIKTLPPGVQGKLIRFSTQQDARQSMAHGEINGFSILADNYLESGRILYIRADFNPMTAIRQSDALKEAIRYNLLKDYPQINQRINDPINLEVHYLSNTPERNPDDINIILVPYIIAFVFFTVIFSSSSMLLNSVTDEKQNRVIEVLMTSISPTQMLAGKIVALGLAGLLQTVVWAAVSITFFPLVSSSLPPNALDNLSPTILIWAVVFFVLGYILYASLMAGLGALVTNLREASQATFVIMIPLLAPLMFTPVMAPRPNGILAVILSLFPFTSPVAMLLRLVSGDIPIWQPIIGIILLAGMDFLVLRSVAGMFRAQNLLTGQAFKTKTFFKALVGFSY